MLNIQLCLTKTKQQNWIYLFLDFFSRLPIVAETIFRWKKIVFVKISAHLFVGIGCVAKIIYDFMTWNFVRLLCTNKPKTKPVSLSELYGRGSCIRFHSFPYVLHFFSGETELLCNSSKNGFQIFFMAIAINKNLVSNQILGTILIKCKSEEKIKFK